MSDSLQIGTLIGVAVTLYSIWCGYVFSYSPIKHPKNKMDIYIAPLVFPLIVIALGGTLLPYLLVESFFKWLRTPPTKKESP